MKKSSILKAAVIAPCLLAGFVALTNVSGAQPGNSGSPQSSGTCNTCHAGGPAIGNQVVTIATDIPASGFEENTNYTITVTANNGGSVGSKIGFEASVESANSSGFAGAIAAGANNQLTSNVNYVTHTASSVTPTNNEISWSFNWNSGTTADAAVYVAVNFSNGNGTTSGDVVVADVLPLTKSSGVGLTEEAYVADFKLYPNPVQEELILDDVNGSVSAFHIFDLSGKVVGELQKEVAQTLEGSWKYDASGLPAGTYIIKPSVKGAQSKTFKKL